MSSEVGETTKKKKFTIPVKSSMKDHPQSKSTERKSNVLVKKASQTPKKPKVSKITVFPRKTSPTNTQYEEFNDIVNMDLNSESFIKKCVTESLPHLKRSKKMKREDGKCKAILKPRKSTKVSLTDSQYEDIFTRVINDSPSQEPKQPNDDIIILSNVSRNTQSQDIMQKQNLRNGTISQPKGSVELTQTSNKQVDTQIILGSKDMNLNFDTPSNSEEDLQTSQIKQAGLVNCSQNSMTFYSQPPSHANLRDRLAWLQERRLVGLWVMCCKPECSKWRYLRDVFDPCEVPKEWFCSMNPDVVHNSCDVPQYGPTPLEDEELIFNSYNCGSIVWAKLKGFPWWPAMVDDDPDTERYFWLEQSYMKPTYYHVVFFDEGNVTRAWVLSRNICPFTEFVRTEGHSTKTKGVDYSRRLSDARKEALRAKQMTVKERLKTYSFLTRYKGHYSDEITVKSSGTGKRVLQNKGRKKKAESTPELVGIEKKITKKRNVSAKRSKTKTPLSEELAAPLTKDCLSADLNHGLLSPVVGNPCHSEGSKPAYPVVKKNVKVKVDGKAPIKAKEKMTPKKKVTSKKSIVSVELNCEVPSSSVSKHTNSVKLPEMRPVVKKIATPQVDYEVPSKIIEVKNTRISEILSSTLVENSSHFLEDDLEIEQLSPVLNDDPQSEELIHEMQLTTIDEISTQLGEPNGLMQLTTIAEISTQVEEPNGLMQLTTIDEISTQVEEPNCAMQLTTMAEISTQLIEPNGKKQPSSVAARPHPIEPEIQPFPVVEGVQSVELNSDILSSQVVKKVKAKKVDKVHVKPKGKLAQKKVASKKMVVKKQAQKGIQFSPVCEVPSHSIEPTPEILSTEPNPPAIVRYPLSVEPDQMSSSTVIISRPEEPNCEIVSSLMSQNPNSVKPAPQIPFSVLKHSSIKSGPEVLLPPVHKDSPISLQLEKEDMELMSSPDLFGIDELFDQVCRQFGKNNRLSDNKATTSGVIFIKQERDDNTASNSASVDGNNLLAGAERNQNLPCSQHQPQSSGVVGILKKTPDTQTFSQKSYKSVDFEM